MAVFNRVILYARSHRANQEVVETLDKLKKYFKKKKVEVYGDADTRTIFKELKLPLLTRDDMGQAGDLIVVVGGDGSLLSAAKMAIKVNVPVVGINRGHLGFLTDIYPDDIEKEFNKLLKGEFVEEHRFLLQCAVSDGKKTYFQQDALNDVVLMQGDEPHLIDFDLTIDNEFICSYRADGLIIATPTGSTAYALSAGGPIIHPSMNAFVLVPMLSHRLSSRPIVVSGDSSIEVLIKDTNEDTPRLSADGQHREKVSPGHKIVLSKNAQQLRLLHPKHYHYYEVLRHKLGWEWTSF